MLQKSIIVALIIDNIFFIVMTIPFCERHKTD